jgi:ubiquinone/menaquinone biosynthesis C-methylase UbiE
MNLREMKPSSDVTKLLNLAVKYQDILKCSRDRDFLKRVYGRGLEFYMNRLKAIDFVGFAHVLDAGCGFGQWSLALSVLNKRVSAIDRNKIRLEIGSRIAEEFTASNISFLVGSLEEVPHKNSSFDAIWCYSSIYQTNYYKTLREFYRLLRRKGLVYISANDWGWHVYNIIVNHNPSRDFSSRRYAVKTMLNTLRYSLTNKYVSNVDLVMPKNTTVNLMKNVGFKNVNSGGEGCIVRNPDYERKPIYPSRYAGLNNVYEIIGER